MTDKVQKIREEVEKRFEQIKNSEKESDSGAFYQLKELLEFIDSLQKELVSEDLEKTSNELKVAADNALESITDQYDIISVGSCLEMFRLGAEWKKNHLWKPADGDDLPEYEREVIVLVKYSTQRNIHDEEYPTYRVEFAHRPNPEGWDAKSIITEKVERYIPETYGKGGWNIPDVKFWLDCLLPNMEEN